MTNKSYIDNSKQSKQVVDVDMPKEILHRLTEIENKISVISTNSKSSDNDSVAQVTIRQTIKITIAIHEKTLTC